MCKSIVSDLEPYDTLSFPPFDSSLDDWPSVVSALEPLHSLPHPIKPTSSIRAMTVNDSFLYFLKFILIPHTSNFLNLCIFHFFAYEHIPKNFQEEGIFSTPLGHIH